MHPGVPPLRMYLSSVSAAAGRGLARLAARAPRPASTSRRFFIRSCAGVGARILRRSGAGILQAGILPGSGCAETPSKARGDRDARCARGNRMAGTRRTRDSIAALAALTILLPALSVAGLHRDVLASPTSQAANSPFGVVITAMPSDVPTALRLVGAARWYAY